MGFRKKIKAALVSCVFAPVLVILLFDVGAAVAAQIFTNPLAAPFSGYASNDPASAATDQQIADDFTLSAAETIRSISWWGNYGQDESELGTSTQFSIRIFHDDGSGLSPANSAPIFLQNVNSFAAYTGVSTSGDNREIFNYTANILPTILSAGTYWLSVVESDATTINESWEWTSTSSGSGAINVLRHPPENWILDCSLGFGAPCFVGGLASKRNRPFALYNSFEAISPAPEPTTLTVLGLGLAALGLMRCRKLPGGRL